MTTIPIQTLTGVRLTCKRCSATVIIPLGAKNAPDQCFNCYHPLPGSEVVRGLVRELTWLKEQVGNAAIGIDAALEGEA